MTDPVLCLEDIVVRAGGRTLLEVPDFTVAAGQSVALIGPNGAGKTTLLHTAALLRKPEGGAVWIRGTRAAAGNAAALRRTLSVVFQDPLLFDVRVLVNAAAGLRFQGCARTEAEARARSWLKRFGVEHLAECKARGLSGGEASRVALARAFATEPALLLLDEPFGALDAPSRAALLPSLRDSLRETGTAATLVTHDPQEAMAFSDLVVVMVAGRIVASGSAPALMARPHTREVAELLGIENVLLGDIIGREGSSMCIALHPGGSTIRVASNATVPSPDERQVTLTLPAGAARVLRPDQEAPPAWNRLPGEVREVQWRASGSRLVVETPAPFAALAPWESIASPWSIGDRAVVTFAPEAAHLIPGSR